MGFVVRHQSGAGDREFGLIIGVCSGQASVAAVALALGPYRFLTRLSVAGFIMALAMLPFVVMGLVEGQLEITLAINGAILVQFAFVQLPLWILRRRRGWRLALDEVSSTPESNPAQFGIRQLLLWTAGVACILAIARALLPQEFRWGTRGPGVGMAVTVFVLLLTFHTLLPLPLIWAALARRQVLRKGALGLAIVGVLAWTEPWAFKAMLGSGSGDQSLFWYLNGAHAAWLVGTLLLVRLCGYRFSG